MLWWGLVFLIRERLLPRFDTVVLGVEFGIFSFGPRQFSVGLSHLQHVVIDGLSNDAIFVMNG